MVLARKTLSRRLKPGWSAWFMAGLKSRPFKAGLQRWPSTLAFKAARWRIFQGHSIAGLDYVFGSTSILASWQGVLCQRLRIFIWFVFSWLGGFLRAGGVDRSWGGSKQRTPFGNDRERQRQGHIAIGEQAWRLGSMRGVAKVHASSREAAGTSIMDG